MVLGVNSIQVYHLVNRSKIDLLPLHIKLGIVKQFVKALTKNADCFRYICCEFSELTIEKLNAGVFNGPQSGD